jgi:hypothetical protein
MADAKHTPGPWDYVSGRTLHHVETQIDNPVGAGIPVCSIPKSREADARLIAAAPDLLEALKVAYGLSDVGVGLMFSKRQAMARAAIAKAEGR